MEKIQQIKEKLIQLLNNMVLANGLFHDVDMDGINYGRAKEIVSKSRKELLEALALIDEMPKTGVWVEIPKPIKIDDLVFCHSSCPFKPLKRTCIRNWNKPLTDHIGPGCPRFKGEPK